MIAGYLARETFLHKLPAGRKLLALAAIGLIFPFVPGWWLPAVVLLAALTLYALCGTEALNRLKVMRTLVLFLAFIGVIQGLGQGWAEALNVVLRMLAMVLLADLVTFSTTMREMMGAIEPLLKPFARFGLNPQRIALAVALVMRFIPYLLANWRERDEAHRARTGRGGGWRIIAPFIVETLRLADRVAETLEARGAGMGRNGN